MGGRPALLQRPVLHLISHGVELLLKYPLLRAGRSPKEVAREFGHDLRKLWSHDASGALRRLIRERAQEAWKEAAQSGMWEDDF